MRASVSAVSLSEAAIDCVLRSTEASALREALEIQSLWSGYGQILRCRLTGGAVSSVIVKHIRLGGSAGHPRGWNTDRSHQRKLRSYEVEAVWYRNWAEPCDTACRVPACLGLADFDGETVLVLEDLDAAGFPARSVDAIPVCLDWLAHFHATFLGTEAEDLWAQGTYWHLATRPDELAALEDDALRAAAPAIDARLEATSFRTLVHGDAKLANVCFAADGSAVAAVDFQYVGGGCGMKDVAYFLGSCLDERACAARCDGLLDCYFDALRQALALRQPEVDAVALEADWRALFPLAWADFHRFLKGWSPGHWKLNDYSERLTRAVIASL
jgi:hypothetical protein